MTLMLANWWIFIVIWYVLAYLVVRLLPNRAFYGFGKGEIDLKAGRVISWLLSPFFGVVLTLFFIITILVNIFFSPYKEKDDA